MCLSLLMSKVTVCDNCDSDTVGGVTVWEVSGLGVPFSQKRSCCHSLMARLWPSGVKEVFGGVSHVLTKLESVTE